MTDGATTRRRFDTVALRWVLLRWVLFAIPVVLIAERAWSKRWMSDDGFINLRVVREVLAGHGPVLNAHERVEVATSPLWVAILTVADVLTPVRLEWIAVLLGIAATVAGVVLALAAARRLFANGAAAVLLPAGAIVFVVVSPVWDFASSGLESGLAIGWLGACCLVTARWASDPERRVSAWAALLVGIGPLVRPDFGIFTGALVAAYVIVMWQEGARRDVARVVGIAAAPTIVSEVLRGAYYGVLVPNTALAKEGGRLRFAEGADYVRNFVDAYWLWVPLVALAVFAYAPAFAAFARAHQPRRVAVLAAFAAGGLLHGLYVVAIGGDFMHARLLLPSFFALCAPVAAVPLRRLAIAGAAIATAWALVCLVAWRPPSNLGAANRAFIGDVRQAATAASHRSHPVTLADYGAARDDRLIRRYLAGGDRGLWSELVPLRVPPADDQPVPAVAMFGIGIRAYALGTDWYVLDLVGLGDSLDAHFRLDRRGTPGHEKPMPPAWVAARMVAPGAPVDLNSFPVPRFARPLFTSTAASFPHDVDNARRALRCHDVRDLHDAIAANLTVRRAFTNLFGALHRTRLRIPPDPADAVRELC